MHRLFLRGERALINDGYRQAGDGDAFAGGFFGDVGLPDLGAAACVHGGAGADHKPLRDGADVVGVDFDANRAEFVGVDGHPCGDGAEAFGENARCAAVENAEGLGCTFVDRHAAFEEVIADLEKLQPDMFAHIAEAEGLEVFDGVLFMPDQAASPLSFGARDESSAPVSAAESTEHMPTVW